MAEKVISKIQMLQNVFAAVRLSSILFELNPEEHRTKRWWFMMWRVMCFFPDLFNLKWYCSILFNIGLFMWIHWICVDLLWILLSWNDFVGRDYARTWWIPSGGEESVTSQEFACKCAKKKRGDICGLLAIVLAYSECFIGFGCGLIGQPRKPPQVWDATLLEQLMTPADKTLDARNIRPW